MEKNETLTNEQIRKELISIKKRMAYMGYKQKFHYGDSVVYSDNIDEEEARYVGDKDQYSGKVVNVSISAEPETNYAGGLDNYEIQETVTIDNGKGLFARTAVYFKLDKSK